MGNDFSRDRNPVPSTASANACIDDETAERFIAGELPRLETRFVAYHIGGCFGCRMRLRRSELSERQVQRLIDRGQRISDCLGPYRLGRLLGASGMGSVYAAHDERHDRPVAIKVLSPRSSESVAKARERLAFEARAAARVAHPNIVPIYDVGAFGDESYIVMMLVEGDDLRAWLAREPRDCAAILAATGQAGRALAHAHAHGLAHGDFKPNNVLIDDTDHVWVIDFGLARAFTANASGTRTPNGETEAWGAPAYMAPEQWEGRGVDAHSDQFSFCVCVWEAMYDAHPFGYNRRRASRGQPPVTWTPVTPAGGRAVPRGIQDALRRGLAVEPEQRFASMDDLLAALTAASGETFQSD